MRRANIGLYTDRMVLSVQESVQEGSYCLLRRQVQEDFLNEQGSLDVDKTVQAAEGLAQLAQQLFCSSTPSGDMGCCAMKRAVGRDWSSVCRQGCSCVRLVAAGRQGRQQASYRCSPGSQSQSAHTAGI